MSVDPCLLRQAKELALSEGTTLRELVELGLRKEIAVRLTTDYRLIDASFHGSGLQPGIDERDWRSITEITYEGRGG